MTDLQKLEPRWIDAIHTRLLTRFGSKWIAANAGVDERLVKEDWLRELSGFGGVAIRHALDNLPVSFPPTLGEFKALCLRAPLPQYKQLEAPKADKAKVDAALAQMGKLKRPGEDIGPRAWARRLKAREEQGDRLTRAQRDAWRDALGERVEVQA